MNFVLAIDPGNIHSGITVINKETYKPALTGKLRNDDIERVVFNHFATQNVEVVIEQIACYGMAVGREVFDTATWSGRFIEIFTRRGWTVEFLPRMTVKMNICHSPKAGDQNITQALADRFAPGEKSKGKGTKKAPGWFYGFAADIWQAYALGVTYIDMKKGIAV